MVRDRKGGPGTMSWTTKVKRALLFLHCPNTKPSSILTVGIASATQECGGDLRVMQGQPAEGSRRGRGGSLDTVPGEE